MCLSVSSPRHTGLISLNKTEKQEINNPKHLSRKYVVLILDYKCALHALKNWLADVNIDKPNKINLQNC